MQIMSWSQIPQDISSCCKSFLMRNLCLSELHINSNANDSSPPCAALFLIWLGVGGGGLQVQQAAWGSCSSSRWRLGSWRHRL